MKKNDSTKTITLYARTVEPAGQDMLGGPVVETKITISPMPPMTNEDWLLFNNFDAYVHKKAALAFEQAAVNHTDQQVVQHLTTCAAGFRAFAESLISPVDIIDETEAALKARAYTSLQELEEIGKSDSLVNAFLKALDIDSDREWEDFSQRNPEAWARREEADARSQSSQGQTSLKA